MAHKIINSSGVSQNVTYVQFCLKSLRIFKHLLEFTTNFGAVSKSKSMRGANTQNWDCKIKHGNEMFAKIEQNMSST